MVALVRQRWEDSGSIFSANESANIAIFISNKSTAILNGSTFIGNKVTSKQPII